MKCVKKQKTDKKSGSSSKPSRLYIFHEQMSFLKKITDTSVAHESTPGDTNEEGNKEMSKESGVAENAPNDMEQSNKNTVSQNRRKRNINEVDMKMMSFIDHQMNAPKAEENENRHSSFFKSLLPSVASLNDDETLEFQAGVISLLRQIKKQKEVLSNCTRPATNNIERQQSCFPTQPYAVTPSQLQHTGYSSNPQQYGSSQTQHYGSSSHPQHYYYSSQSNYSSQSTTPSPVTDIQSPLGSLQSPETQNSFDTDIHF